MSINLEKEINMQNYIYHKNYHIKSKAHGIDVVIKYALKPHTKLLSRQSRTKFHNVEMIHMIFDDE